MRFTKPFWAGIGDGSVTVAIRRWKKPTVVVGRPYRTGGGRVEVISVDQIDHEQLGTEDAVKAGYASVGELHAALPPPAADRSLYRVEFRLLDEPDPRAVLAADDNLSAEDLQAIATRLERFDGSSGHGPWTHATLRLIADHPGRRAPDLAEMVGRETKPFKLDVRKLKNLGLTLSLKIGYELSPRGIAYLARQTPAAD